MHDMNDASRDASSEQAEFVAWWDGAVRERGQRSNVTDHDTFGLVASDATEQTGISKMQVSRWRKRLTDRLRYRDAIILNERQPNHGTA